MSNEETKVPTEEAEELEFQCKASEVLAEVEREIDADTLQRLADARREAVGLADANSRVWRTPMIWGLTGSAAAAVLAFAVFTPALLGPGMNDLPPLDQPEFVVAQDAELLEELEFVAWMMAAENSGEEESGETPVSS